MHFYPTLIHAGFIGVTDYINIAKESASDELMYKGLWNKNVIFFINFVFSDKYFMKEHLRQIRDTHLTMNYFN